MAVKASGRFVPPSAFAAGTGKTFTGAYAWNAPREAVGRERPLTRDEMRQVQGVLSTINRLPYFLRSLFTSRYDYIRRNKSPVHGFYFLTSTFQRRLWPRIERVNQRHEMNTDASLLFLAERDHYARLPGMNDKELKKFAARISSQLFMMYEELSDAWVDAHGEKESLFTDEAQDHLYGHVAGAARAFNISPLYWKKYRKGQMTTRQAYSAIARLFNDEWWTHQLKGQRMRWHEALLIAVGEVNKDRSPYASKHAIRDVRARRQANLEFLKSCDLENRETGERIDLISKVMGSISNPEIRRMELMNTIAGIERYAAAEGDVGMFITLTAPSKYHPTRQVRKGESKTVQLNHGWNDEAFNPKDAQRYLCRIWSLMRTAFKDNDLQVTRTTDWRIVPKIPVVEPLTLKSGIAAPRSPVNNCGKLTGGDTSLPAPTASEHAAAVLNLLDDGVIEWSDPEVVRALRGALKHGLRTPNRQQRAGSPLKPHEIAPSARMTRSERMQITRIRVDLAQNGIRPQRWVLEALARGATVNYDGKKFTYPVADEWPGFSTVMEWK